MARDLSLPVREIMHHEVQHDAERMAASLRDVAQRIEDRARWGTEMAIQRQVLGMSPHPRTSMDTAQDVLAEVRSIMGSLHTESLVRRADEADRYDREHPEEG